MSVRLGIIGLGNMGQGHCRLLQKIDTIELVAVCDILPDRLNKVTERYGVTGYDDADKLMRDPRVDAVLIATPHYDHTTLGIRALKRGLHVLVEKPISVHKADCEKLIRTHTNSDQVFAAMFNQRTNPQYQYIRDRLQDGTFGAVRRMHWTITDWFRSQSYYDSGGWRAMWATEGGGVLMNQCPHQLDLLQWLFGMPERLQAFCHLGKHHHIEVEDDVTCYLEFAGGATGVFTTTTGEAPGTNRLEIATEAGLIVHDAAANRIDMTLNDKPVSQAIRENADFTKPETHTETVTFDTAGDQHAGILRNFADAIMEGAPLIARAEEGINSVELANAMLLSSLTGRTQTLPISARGFANRLKRLVRESTFVKPEATGKVADDMGSSF